MKYCTMCGSQIPEHQNSNVCSWCYGDPDHGNEGYYQEYLEKMMEDEGGRVK